MWFFIVILLVNISFGVFVMLVIRWCILWSYNWECSCINGNIGCVFFVWRCFCWLCFVFGILRCVCVISVRMFCSMCWVWLVFFVSMIWRFFRYFCLERILFCRLWSKICIMLWWCNSDFSVICFLCLLLFFRLFGSCKLLLGNYKGICLLRYVIGVV